MNRALWLSLPLLSLALFGCPPPVDTGDGGTGPFTVTPKGGQFARDGVYFSFPEGAVEAEEGVTISVTVIDTGIPEVPNRKRVSFGYRISPQSLTLKKPYTVGISWIQDRVPPGVQPSSFDMRRQNGNDAYLELPSPQLMQVPFTDVQGIVASSDKLGTFWLTSPAQAAVSEINLTPEAGVFLAVGQEQQFTAEVLDPGGNKIDGAKVTWSVAAPRVGSVDENGLFKALGPGIATLTVASSDVSKTVIIRVQGDTKGPETFVHDTPFPTGNDLLGGAISNGYALFTGDNGTVLSRSPTDQWERRFSAPGISFRAIAANYPTSAVAVGVNINTGILVEVKSGSATAPAVQTFTSALPRAVWFDGTHGMAVGDGNDVIIRRNGTWTKLYSPSFESLFSVIGDGAGGFVTVGNLGSIYKYDPAKELWDSLYQTQLAVQLQAGALVDAGGNEAWAVGGNKLWHFVTNSWTALNLPTSPVVSSAQALGIIDSRIVIAATTSTGASNLLIYEPVGATWTSQTVRSPQVIRGVFGTGTQGYAVGDYGAVWQYDSTTKLFVERSRGEIGHIADIAAVGTDVVAAMNVCMNAACTSIQPKVIKRESAGNWTQVGSAPFGGQLTALAMKSVNEIYAATPTALYVWDGSTWSTMSVTGTPPPPSDPNEPIQLPSFRDLAICGTSLWTVGEVGVQYKGSANATPIRSVAFANSGTKQDLYGVTCPTANNIWSTGIGVLIERGSTGAASLRNTTGIQHGPYLNVWSPGAGEAFAFGDAQFGSYWNTANVFVVDGQAGEFGGILPDVLTSQWGSSADNHYVVGYVSQPVRYAIAFRGNGAQFKLIDPGTDKIPLVITGTSNTDVWMGTQYGGILHGKMPP